MRADLLAKDLAGRRVGADWVACCPAHDDRTPSLSIREVAGGKILIHCHAGCEQARVLAALRQRGLWAPGDPSGADTMEARIASDVQGDDRTRLAARLWKRARPANDTPVQTYLRERAITLSPPGDLRFVDKLKHPEGSVWPAMLALVRRGADGEPLGVHRTFLSWDGRGKAPVSPQKMMLGPSRGGVVCLGPTAAHLMVGEGIETSLSAMQAHGTPAWAALSTSGLRTLDLPSTVTHVTVLADGDAAGLAAAESAAQRWLSEGRTISIAKPPAGLDFNDLLRGGE
jgi:hypothetical protein